MKKDYSKYHKSDYTKGSIRFNIHLASRKLIISALKKTNWDIDKAYDLNFPLKYITIAHYKTLIKKHQINVKEKTFVKISEMN